MEFKLDRNALRTRTVFRFIFSWTPNESVAIHLKELGCQMSKCLNFAHGLKLKPIFTQKWASVDMNLGFNPPPPGNSNLGYCHTNSVSLSSVTFVHPDVGYRFSSDISSDWWGASPLTKFGQFFIGKSLNLLPPDARLLKLLRLKCARIDFGWGDNSYFVPGNIVTLVLYYYRADTAERCRLC